METSWMNIFTLMNIVVVFGTTQSIDYMETTDDTVKNKIWDGGNCPRECSCYKGQLSVSILNEIKYMNTVNCAGRGLEDIPLVLPDDTEVLLLSNNNFTKVTKLPYSSDLVYLDLSNASIEILTCNNLFFGFKKLKYLNLSNNKLNHLQQYCFTGLSNLYYLDISKNKLTNISSSAFTGLNNLKSFNIADNLLNRVSPDWFADVSDDLRELDFSNNLLTFIETNDFSALSKLNLLNLSSNKIRTIDNNAFSNLTNMLILDLSYNQMQLMPKELLHLMKILKKFIFDGNPMRKIHTGDFQGMNVAYLSISYMPELHFIEKHAFQNLPLFTTLEAHDNPKLIYVDSQAFDNVPSLSTLYLHNNQIAALSPSLIQYIPSLEEIHLYRNPIRCDCNAFWIKELITEATATNYSKPFFNHSQYIKCNFPLNLTGTSIANVTEDKFSRVCAPTTLPAFKENYTMDLGEELRIECHAYGVPEPKLTWLLPNQTVVSGDFQSKKFELVDSCVLIIRYLTLSDSGTYACKADNGIAVDLSSTRITVTNKPVRLVIFRVSFDYVSLSWNGTRHYSMISDYQLQYRELKKDNKQNITNQNHKYKVIPLAARYRSYTVTNLKPKTLYEFCIVYVYDTELYKVDCRILTTKDHVEYHSAIKKVISEKIIAGVCTALGIVMAIACMVTLVKKFRLHKDYESPYNIEETESINIPLENVYRPTSTQMCSSKTSLLSVQTHKSALDEY
ncbi:leucine-rich repeat neuronal protein 1-like [Ruditapes philippinarum]|uniref:leucine-rich repeat neuronal protein 1-like n=1 Tax=Ruditapes philippinarum TaxID=129788 RepID=UPI00295BFBEC|nr:leucine-rich repeat neuronal protein 1-like [Ruditapes philippinarum]XP_060579198.1 leucine-rich repeat neuronal protein 1-like [Ruditapes philippinarum]XP_060579199.1 leucine-rich repeat neuronal protein 1-like [Ruditapes philippinarum]